MFEVRFTKTFTGGALEGFPYQAAAQFINRHVAEAFVRLALEFPEVRKPCAGSPYRIENPHIVFVEDATSCHI